MSIETANRLIEYRKKHGYTQEELADKLGVSRQAVSKWERSEASPDTENLIALSKLYGCSLDELLNVDPSDTEETAEVVDSPLAKNTDAATEERSKGGKVKGIVGSISGFVCLLAYILFGIFYNEPAGIGWAMGWTFLLLPSVAMSLVDCIYKKRLSPFGIGLLAVAVYCGLGIYGSFHGIFYWHPYWLILLVIPAWYAVASPIDIALYSKRHPEKDVVTIEDIEKDEEEAGE